MNIFAGTASREHLPPLSLRPEQPADEEFLFELYASTREEELALTGWDAATRGAFLRHQFSAMRLGYQSMFPNGEFSIIELAGQAGGRMVLDRASGEIRVVDLALLPAHRNQGIGTWLMQQVCATADKPVRLSVLKDNRAQAWYARLGFSKVEDLGVYDDLEWRPEVKPGRSRG